jgi:hypothetical protein
MLNRKLTNSLFYLIILIVLAVVYLVRMIMLGNIEGEISELDKNNEQLQNQILQLEQTVEENRYFDQSFRYELYDAIPSTFNQTQLVYDTNALLELAGINLSPEMMRSVVINPEPSLISQSPVSQIANEYNIVQITIYFNTNDLSLINDYIDILEESNQLYLLNTLNYSYPIINEYVPIQLSYYAFYLNE